MHRQSRLAFLKLKLIRNLSRERSVFEIKCRAFLQRDAIYKIVMEFFKGIIPANWRLLCDVVVTKLKWRYSRPWYISSAPVKLPSICDLWSSIDASCMWDAWKNNNNAAVEITWKKCKARGRAHNKFSRCSIGVPSPLFLVEGESATTTSHHMTLILPVRRDTPREGE